MSMLELEALQRREEKEIYAREMDKRRRVEQGKELPEPISLISFPFPSAKVIYISKQEKTESRTKKE